MQVLCVPDNFTSCITGIADQALLQASHKLNFEMHKLYNTAGARVVTFIHSFIH